METGRSARQSFADELKRLWTAAGNPTLAKVSEDLGVARSTISDWKNGDHLPDDVRPLVTLVDYLLARASDRRNDLGDSRTHRQRWKELYERAKLTQQAKRSRGGRPSNRMEDPDARVVAAGATRPMDREGARSGRSSAVGPSNNERGFRTYGYIPPRSERHIARDDIVDTARSAIVSHRTVALWGMGGAGKTTLAADIARDVATRSAFPDGIAWIDAKRDADPKRLQERLARNLLQHRKRREEDREPVIFQSVEEGRDWLAAELAGRAVLLIVDDVWDTDTVRALDTVDRAHGALLITTRNQAIARPDGHEPIAVEKLTDEQALGLLAHWTRRERDRIPPLADSLCRQVGNLALGVALVGGMIDGRGGRLRAWREVSDLLDQADIEAIKNDFTPDGYAHPSVLASIKLSVDELDWADRNQYRELAVFDGRGRIPREAIEALWASAGDDIDSVAQRLGRLVDRCLVQCEGDDEEEWYTLHDLEFDFVSHQLAAKPGGIAAAHDRLLVGYVSRLPYEPCGTGSDFQASADQWASGPNDGYLLQNLAFHLTKAGREDQLDELLTSFAWMERKLSATDIIDLLADYSHRQPYSIPVEAVHGALQLSAHVVAREPQLLAGQLVGRLMVNSEPQVRDLVVTARPLGGGIWLRPETPGSLTEPGGPLERTLQGAKDAIEAVAISADGKQVVAGGRDKAIRVWERTTGRSKPPFEGHRDEVRAVAVSADGQRIVSGGFDGTVRVWISFSGRVERELPCGGDYIYAVAIAPDSQHVIVGGGDSKLQIWNLADSRLERALTGHRKQINAVALSADGRYVVSGGFDQIVRVWDLSNNDPNRELPGNQGPIAAVAISADGRHIVSGGQDKSVRVWDLDSDTPGRIVGRHEGQVRAVAVSGDGRRVISAGNKVVRVWDPFTESLEHELIGHEGLVHSVAVTGDGRSVVSGGHDRTVRVWDLARVTTERHRQSKNSPVGSIAFVDDGRCVLVAGYGQPVALRDLSRGGVQHPLQGIDASIDVFAVAADGRRLVSGGFDPGVWDLSSGQLLFRLSDQIGSANAVAISADSRYVMTGGGDSVVRVWDLDSGTLKWSGMRHDKEVYAVTVTADNRYVVSAGFDKIVRVWDLERGHPVGALCGHEARIDTVAAAPDGRLLASADRAGSVRVWDLDRMCPSYGLPGHSRGFAAVAITADCRYIVSGGSDQTVRAWDLETGVERARWHAEAAVTACAVHPHDPSSLAYGDESGRVAILSLRESR